MNKKQLQESIMAGVKRAFKTNKSLNEGFSAWREENAPKFPLDQLNNNAQPLINLYTNYINQNYIDSVEFGIVFNDKYQRIGGKLDKELIARESSKLFLTNRENELKNKCTKGEDQFNRVMFLTYLKILIPYESIFGKYVKSTINGGSNRINDYEDLIVTTMSDNFIVLVINNKDLLNVENVNKIIEYFK